MKFFQLLSSLQPWRYCRLGTQARISGGQHRQCLVVHQETRSRLRGMSGLGTSVVHIRRLVKAATPLKFEEEGKKNKSGTGNQNRTSSTTDRAQQQQEQQQHAGTNNFKTSSSSSSSSSTKQNMKEMDSINDDDGSSAGEEEDDYYWPFNFLLPLEALYFENL